MFHPRVHDLFAVDMTRWLLVHYLQIPLFLLVALSVCWLVRDERGVAAQLCRLAMLVFASTFLAFDTAAGVVVGELIDMARSSGTIDQWRAPIMALWHHPIVGGSGTPAPLLASLGKMSWLIGCTAAGIVVRARGASLFVVALLVTSGLGLYVFMTHAWPGGPVTFGALGLAALLQRRRRAVIGREDGLAVAAKTAGK
jgi:hypothetical protein